MRFWKDCIAEVRRRGMDCEKYFNDCVMGWLRQGRAYKVASTEMAQISVWEEGVLSNLISGLI